MASNINPNNIDGTYPVAGQDNNSQGFRDNFTNTKTNFTYAKEEITDLQNKVVLKAALTGTTLDNDMLGAVLSNMTLNDVGWTFANLGTQTGNVGINYAAGNYQVFQTSGPVSIAFTNWPAAGILGWIAFGVIVNNVAHTITFPASVTVNQEGITGFDAATNTFTAPVPGVYRFGFLTTNGGSTVAFTPQINNILVPLNNSSQDLANAAAASLGVTATYFSTAAAETGTLAAGVQGQVKTFMMYADSGDMVITVTNAGWKTSGTGTMTFDTIGDACTLQYVNGKWFCIGNNGVVFA